MWTNFDSVQSSKLSKRKCCRFDKMAVSQYAASCGFLFATNIYAVVTWDFLTVNGGRRLTWTKSRLSGRYSRPLVPSGHDWLSVLGLLNALSSEARTGTPEPVPENGVGFVGRGLVFAERILISILRWSRCGYWSGRGKQLLFDCFSAPRKTWEKRPTFPVSCWF